MYFGAAYYPEHIDNATIEKDIPLMKQAGLNVMRMGEFSWIKMEPQDGEFDFSWLEQAVNKLGKNGIDSLLCTPTATPPKWITDKHPEILQLMSNGHRREYGVRRHYCINSRSYHFYTERITKALAEHFKDNPYVIGYQLDNEFMAENPYCFCPTCTIDFQDWLKKKYETIENLNKSWGTVFWSQCLRNFQEVAIPKHDYNPSAVLDFYNFASDSFISYARFQRDILKQVSPSKAVTHNVCSSGFLYRMDLYKMGEFLDIVSVDNYTLGWTLEGEYGNFKDIEYNPSLASLAMAMTRSIKKSNFWVTESQVGGMGGYTMGETVEPGYVRLWTHQHIAHGGRMNLYFPWRTCRFSCEQLLQGIVDYDTVPRRRYDEVKKTVNELSIIQNEIAGMQVDARVGIIRDFRCDWSFETKQYSNNFRYMRNLHAYYDALIKGHITVDIVNVQDDFSKYKMMVVPSLILVDDNRADKLEQFVNNGGTLIITYLSGLRNMENVIINEPFPGKLSKITGIQIEEQDGLYKDELVSLKIVAGEFENESYSCSTWCDVIQTTTASPIAVYEKRFYEGSPAITKNNYGKGVVYYIGTLPAADFLKKMLVKAASDVGVYPAAACTSSMVEIVEAEKGNTRYIYIINYGKSAEVIKVYEKYTDLLSGKLIKGEVTLESMQVMVLRQNL